MDKYELGDLSGKFGNFVGQSSVNKQFTDVQLDLFGRYSILNRAYVIHRNDATGSRWICANIVPDSSSKQLSATSNFSTTSGLNGIVNLVSVFLSIPHFIVFLFSTNLRFCHRCRNITLHTYT